MLKAAVLMFTLVICSVLLGIGYEGPKLAHQIQAHHSRAV